MNRVKILTNGLLKENPNLVLILGMCPALAVTTSAGNGAGMGIATTFVLLCSNILISTLKNVIPNKVRIPIFIILIATFTTIVDLLLQAYVPVLANNLGIFIPLIVVNCILLGRAEAFAGKNSVLNSLLDGIGMGLGFTLSLTLIGTIREILGNGPIFEHQFIAGKEILIFILPPGAFIVIGFLIAVVNFFRDSRDNRDKRDKCDNRDSRDSRDKIQPLTINH
jgi:electron transport complex protein RnfE